MFARHELQRAMRSKMQNSIGCKCFAEIGVIRGKGVVRGKSAFEQKPHGVALIAKRRLKSDEQIAELTAENVDPTAIA